MSRTSPVSRRSPHLGGGLRTARALLWITAIILIAGFAAFSPMVFSGTKNAAIIRIPRNATSENVRDSLSKYFSANFAKRTMHLLNLRRIDFSKRYGSYEIPEGTSPFNAMRRLGSGGQQPVDITINGFRTLPLLVQRISAKLNFSPDELMKAVTDSATLASYGLKPSQALALFIDDTYEVYWTATPRDVVKKIGQHYKNTWNNTRLRKAKHLGLTPADVMIICSITDEETNQESEKEIIGRLYLNRLQAGMRLQADPTVRYAMRNFTLRRILDEHLKVASPYNTYRVDGLPPGPIRTTSVTSIDALLNSRPHNFLYMCAKEDFSGFHNFAATYNEHVANALRYQHALNSRGIK